MDAPREPAGPANVRLWARRLVSYFTVGGYMVALPFGCVGVLGLCALWRADDIVRARRMQRLTAAAYRFMHDWLRLVRIADFNHRGALPELPTGACVVVANHPTLMDITSITAVLGGGFTIVKPAIHEQRLVRPFIAGAGHVAAAGSSPMSLQRVVDDCEQRLAQGFRAIIFPEGTRSHVDRLRPFGRTAFEIACRAHVPVVSVTIDCTPVYLSKEVSVFRPPDPTARLKLLILAVDDPADCGFDSRALLKRVEGRYLDWHAGRHLAAPKGV